MQANKIPGAGSPLKPNNYETINPTSFQLDQFNPDNDINDFDKGLLDRFQSFQGIKGNFEFNTDEIDDM